MPDRVRKFVKKIDESRDKVREDDFFKDLDAEVLIDLVTIGSPQMISALRALASAFVQRNQEHFKEAVEAGINLGEEFAG